MENSVMGVVLVQIRDLPQTGAGSTFDATKLAADFNDCAPIRS